MGSLWEFIQMKRILVLLALPFLGLIISSNKAQAAPLTPGSSATSGIVAPLPAGLVFVTGTGVQPYTQTDVFGNVIGTGLTEENVYREASGTLDFLYIIMPATDRVERLTASSNPFNKSSTWGPTIDVGSTNTPGLMTIPPGTIAPSQVDYSPSGKVVGFTFASPGVMPGSTTQVLYIRTQGTLVDVGTYQLIDGGTANLAGFSVAAAVPEPATLTLLAGCGTLGAIGVIRKRRRMKDVLA
jgi:hypothetical protein